MPRPSFRDFVLASSLFLLASLANAGVQVPDVKRIANPSPAANAAFGKAVLGIGDVNGDGIGDLVVSAPGADKVYILSGKDQTILHTVGDLDLLSGFQFGFSLLNVGDWNGDGIDDFAVGAPGVPKMTAPVCLAIPCTPDPQRGRVFIVSGATGMMIKKIDAPDDTLQFGFAIALLGDINGDGKPDLAIGAPVSQSGLGSVYAMSGVDGTQIWKVSELGIGLTKQPFASLGYSLATLRDINGDGKADLLVGAPSHDDGTGKNAGAAYVLSGADGKELRSHVPPQIVGDDRFGISVANVTDQNNDGVNDYIIGDPKASKVHLFNGADGAYLAGISSRQLNDTFGYASAVVSDYDGDHVADFFVAAPDGDRVYLMNKSGTEILHVANPAPDTHSFGRALSATRDLGGDNGLDLLIGAPDELSGSGAAYLVTIRENRPPVANAGPDQLIECDRGGIVTLDGSASSDPDKDPITYEWKQVSGTAVNLTVSGAKATFAAAPPGVYEFQLKVTDDKGASSTDNVVITIKDTKPPVLFVTLDPTTLWPPNHKFVDVAATIRVTDLCDPNPTVKLVSIVSSEPVNSTGDGNTSPDITGASYGEDDRSFQLRAERKGNGAGRIYSIKYEAEDASGNTADQTGSVIVPHSMAAVSQPKLTFESVQVGKTSAAQTITISNASPDPMQISSITLSSGSGSDFSATEHCAPAVPAESSCSINVVFKPAATGLRTALLVISGDAVNLPQQIALSGTGIAALTPDYDVSSSPASATIKQGQSATFALTITPVNGFSDSLSFSCSGLPAGAGCVFSPATVKPNGAPIVTTLTVTTTAPSVRSALPAPTMKWLGLHGGTLVAALFLVPGICQRKTRRRYWLALIMILLLAVVLFSIGCGGGGNSTTTPPAATGGTPVGTSQIMVSTTLASGAAGQHNVNLSITVTP